MLKLCTLSTVVTTFTMRVLSKFPICCPGDILLHDLLYCRGEANIQVNIMYLHFLVVPDPVRSLQLSIDVMSLVLNWTEPARTNGIVSYLIDVTATDQATSAAVTGFSTTVVGTQLNVTTPLPPFVLYTASVVATTSVGNSSAEDAQLTTPQGGVRGSIVDACNV